MEEILGSAYPTSKIIRPDLGLDEFRREDLTKRVESEKSELQHMQERQAKSLDSLKTGQSAAFKEADAELLAGGDPAAVQAKLEGRLGGQVRPFKLFVKKEITVEGDGLSESLF